MHRRAKDHAKRMWRGAVSGGGGGDVERSSGIPWSHEDDAATCWREVVERLQKLRDLIICCRLDVFLAGGDMCCNLKMFILVRIQQNITTPQCSQPHHPHRWDWSNIKQWQCPTLGAHRSSLVTSALQGLSDVSLAGAVSRLQTEPNYLHVEESGRSKPLCWHMLWLRDAVASRFFFRWWDFTNFNWKCPSRYINKYK